MRLATWMLGVLLGLGSVSGADQVVSVAPPGEPGQPLMVRGRILKGDQGVAGAATYVYQTDAKGYYSPGGMDERNPRLKARFTTDAEGRFAFRTIQPGPYPNEGPPAHIHLEVTPQGGRTERFELVFAGDPRLTHNIREDARTRGFYAICTPVNGPDGVRFCNDVTFRLH